MKPESKQVSAETSNFHERIVNFVQEELRPIELLLETSGVIPDEIVEKMRRLYRLFEGTSEIQRIVISRNLLKGVKR